MNLKRWYISRPDARPLHLEYFGAHLVNPDIAGIDSQPIPRGLVAEMSDNADTNVIGPLPGWHAVSINRIVGYKHIGFDEPYYTYFQRFRPVAMAGYSIYIYYLEPSDVNRIRRELGLLTLNERESND